MKKTMIVCKRVCLIILFLGGIHWFGHDVLYAETGWSFQFPITVTNYSAIQPLTNFPLLVRLGSHIAGYDSQTFFSPPWHDLHFLDETGTNVLPYEMESFASNGEAVIWVRIPVLTNGTTLLARWGTAGRDQPTYTTNGSVWLADFEAVWHLADVNPPDATQNGNDGLASGGVVLSESSWIDGSLDFNGLNGSIGTPTESRFDFSGPFTVEAWAYTRNTSATYTKGILAKNAATNNTGFALGHYNAQWSFWLGGVQIFSSAGFALNQWRHVVGVYDGSSIRLYINGIQRAGPNSASLINNNHDLLIGRWFRDGHVDRFFNGLIDEVRVSRVARSADWIFASYFSQASNLSFLAYGVVETNETIPVVQALAASGIGATRATLNGRLLSSGGVESPQLYFCWDEQDRGVQGTGDWAHVMAIGTNWNVGQLFSAVLENLQPTSLYYYRAYATNSAGGTWSGAKSFWTRSAVGRQYRWMAPITFVGYTRATTLTNFPALIHLDPSRLEGFSYEQFLTPHRTDLRITDETRETELPYEVESWNTGGTSYLWVQVPLLTNGTTLYLFWGRENEQPPSYATNGQVWSEGFEAVWHLNSTNPPDATRRGYDGSATGDVGMASSTWINGALDFNGTNAAIITATSNLVLTTAFTLEGWAYPRNTHPNYSKGILAKNSSTTNNGYLLANYNGQWLFFVSGTSLSSSSGFALNQWQHVAGVYGNGQMRLYVNGVGRAGPVNAVVLNNSDPLFIGYWFRDGSNLRFFNGILDEIRISNVARSEDWLWATWMNQASNSVFALYGSAVSVSRPGTIIMVR